MKNIIETAVDNPDFSTLVTALKKAELVDTLSGTGPFTVFAPTNKAFEKIPKETLDGILDDTAKLKSILTYHVISDKVMFKDVEKMKEIKTLEGSSLAVTSHSDTIATEAVTPSALEANIGTFGHIMIDEAALTTVDIECSNGVIHVIDTVLMP